MGHENENFVFNHPQKSSEIVLYRGEWTHAFHDFAQILQEGRLPVTFEGDVIDANREDKEASHMVIRVQGDDQSRILFLRQFRDMYNARKQILQREYPPIKNLKGRRFEVVQFACLGLTNYEIGQQLGISEDTVKSYITRTLIENLVVRRSELPRMFVVSQGVSADELKEKAAYDKAKFKTLSPRELDVLQLSSYGLSNNAIANTLFLGKSSVKEYESGACSKLSARGRTHAALLYVLYESDLENAKLKVGL